MSRISCNVTRDLLTVYLDEICSDESKELVEEHLQECEECRQFLGRMKVKEESGHNKQIQFFAKAKKYIDNGYRLVFIIAFLLAGLVGIYSDIYFNFVPEVIIYVSIPILMCTFFLAQPVKQCKEKKYHSLQVASVLSIVLLIGWQIFVVQQLNLVLTSPNDTGLISIFKWEPMNLGPFMEKIYLCFVIIEIVLLVLYYMLGLTKNYSFVIGQNASWIGIGLGLIFRAFLYRLDSPERMVELNTVYISTFLVIFVVVLLLNMIYVKWKSKRFTDTAVTVRY